MSATTVRERPILFSAPMVRAIIAGTKSQTRRVWRERFHPGARLLRQDTVDAMPDREAAAYLSLVSVCPYGAPGDRLWVRETWRTLSGGSVRHPCEVQYQAGGFAERQPGFGEGVGRDVIARADGPGEATDFGKLRWRPSIFMPRWASRIDLEVVAVRVERLQEISEEDARAEGAEALSVCLKAEVSNGPFGSGAIGGGGGYSARDAFKAGWDSINGKRAGASWAENPLVWCIKFRRVRP